MSNTLDERIEAANERVFFNSTENGRIAGQDGVHSEEQLERAQALIGEGEKIFAIYEPDKKQGKKARWQPVCNSCICPPLALFHCCKGTWPTCAKAHAKAYDRSLWVVTNQKIYKDVTGGEKYIGGTACCCCGPLMGSESGSLSYDEVRSVMYNGTEVNICDLYGIEGVDPPGKWCCDYQYVSLELAPGHPLAFEGPVGGKDGVPKQYTTLPMLVDESSEAAALIQYAKRMLEKAAEQLQMERDAEKAGTSEADAAAPAAAAAAPDAEPPRDPNVDPIRQQLWSELEKKEQRRAKMLGFDAKTWNAGKETKTSKKRWAQLTDEEVDAAEFLGYTQKIWDKEPDTPPPEPVVEEESEESSSEEEAAAPNLEA